MLTTCSGSLGSFCCSIVKFPPAWRPPVWEWRFFGLCCAICGVRRWQCDHMVSGTTWPIQNFLMCHQPPLPRICLYLNLIRIRVRWKNLIFPNYKFGKGQYAFYPVKLYRFAEKIKFIGNTWNSYGGTLTIWVRGLSNQWKIVKVNLFFLSFFFFFWGGGLCSSKLHESFWIW